MSASSCSVLLWAKLAKGFVKRSMMEWLAEVCGHVVCLVRVSTSQAAGADLSDFFSPARTPICGIAPGVLAESIGRAHRVAAVNMALDLCAYDRPCACPWTRLEDPGSRQGYCSRSVSNFHSP
jgi:hypothetical protein